MKFMLTGLGNWYPAWNLITAAVPEAEDLGFWAVVLPDTYVWEPQELGVDSADGIDSTFETWTALSYLSAGTSRIKLGTWVTPIPLRPPSILAKTVATVDVLSNGRALLGVGAGLSRKLFEAYNGKLEPPNIRVEKTMEGVELITKLWTQPTVNYQGKYYTAKNAVLEPKPVQKPHPPLLFGGAGKRMLALAGRFADICFIPSWTKMSHDEARSIVMDEAARIGRRGKISFATAYTPLEPGYIYNQHDYRVKAEKASKGGYDYFITAVPFEEAPWLMESSSIGPMTESYLALLRDLGNNIVSSF